MSRKTVMTILLYVLALPVAAASYAVTRGTDGHFVLAIWLFAGLTVLYAAMLMASTSSGFTWQSGLHLVLYEAAAFQAFSYQSRLEEMGGMMPMVVMNLVLAMVFLGALANAVATGVMTARGVAAERKEPMK